MEPETPPAPLEPGSRLLDPEEPTAPVIPVEHGVEPGVVSLWRLSALMGSAFFGIPAATVAAVLLGRHVHPALGALVAATYGLWFAVRVLLWPRLSWERLRWSIRKQDLWISQGVIFRQQTVIPLGRIQFVDLRQGPIERLFGLWHLLIFTASGPSADGGLPGLREPEARALRDQLAHEGVDGI